MSECWRITLKLLKQYLVMVNSGNFTKYVSSKGTWCDIFEGAASSVKKGASPGTDIHLCCAQGN